MPPMSFLYDESGVHRVQRVPVTESGGRIHTSAATVARIAHHDRYLPRCGTSPAAASTDKLIAPLAAPHGEHMIA